MNKKIVSESYKQRMQRLSGVKEVNKSDLDLLKESYFLTEQEMLSEGIKDTALAVLTFLTTVTSVLGRDASQKIQQDLLQTNIKNKKELVDFRKDLEQMLGDNKNTTDYKKFSEKLDELEKMVGKTVRGKESIKKYGNVSVREFEYVFDLKNPGDKEKLDSVLSNIKEKKGLLKLGSDTIIKMMQVVQPNIKASMVDDVKIDNAEFKGYNSFQVDKSIVKNISDKIKNQFLDFDTVSGYILVKGSASNVPTTAFGGSNESLAQARSCSLATQLEEELGDKFKGKIKVDWGVAGPAYANDKDNVEKYAPFQFSKVEINLTASKLSDENVAEETESEIVIVKTLRAGITAEEKVIGFANFNPTTKVGKSSVSCPSF
jgi:hypothetical protein